jgi:hypothetical protein
MPKHAQSKLESWLGANSRESNSLLVDRFAKASIRGRPPDFCGAGKSMLWANMVLATRVAKSAGSIRFMRVTQFIDRGDYTEPVQMGQGVSARTK